MDGENSLHSIAERDASHGECLLNSGTASGYDDSFESLYALGLALDDFRMHRHGISDIELRRFAALFRIDFIHDIRHFKFSLFDSIESTAPNFEKRMG
jgi:hypothetical protein